MKWIDVNELMPKNNEAVVATVKAGGKEFTIKNVVWWKETGKWWMLVEDGLYNPINDVYAGAEVTRWMPKSGLDENRT